MAMTKWGAQVTYGFNMFAPTRTLLHTYSHHHHHHDHHHHHHHIMIIIASKFASPSEQYVGWGNNINFIFMRDQNLPPPLNNMLIGVITSTFPSSGIKMCHPLWTIWGNNINFIFISTWSQTRRRVRVAANMFKPKGFGGSQFWYILKWCW